MWNRKVYRQKVKGNKKQKKSFHPYRSGLEKRVAQVLSKHNYEPKSGKVKYSVPHTYNPDFVHPDNPDVIIEVKGYFRDSSEASKYVSVKRDNPNKEVIFLFSDPLRRATPGCRVRRDGTIMTLQEWAKRNGFLSYSTCSIPKEIIQGLADERWISGQKELQNVNT